MGCGGRASESRQEQPGEAVGQKPIQAWRAQSIRKQNACVLVVGVLEPRQFADAERNWRCCQAPNRNTVVVFSRPTLSACFSNVSQTLQVGLDRSTRASAFGQMNRCINGNKDFLR